MIRFFDFILALVAIIIFLPLMVVVTLVILISSGLPACFFQNRVGKNESIFVLIKFRTMIVNKEGNNEGGHEHLKLKKSELKKLRTAFKTTSNNDNRITFIGKILRSTSIDELPQLFNILKGNMSFVGPRPDLPIQKIDYTSEQWTLRCSVKPGLTGLAQINGRSNIGHEKRIENDLIWVKNKSLMLYFIILFKTPFALFKNVN